jgi:hypothetical protein
MALTVSRSRRVELPPEQAFDRTLAEPLPHLFTRRHGPIPPIKEVRDAPASWDTVGQSRRIVTSDGGTMLERLVRVDRPRAFGYELTGFTGPLAPLVRSIDGEWAFTPSGAGTEVTWSWTLHPRHPVTGLALPAFGLFWRGYAAKALARLDELLAR